MATRPHPRLSTAHLCTARVPRAKIICAARLRSNNSSRFGKYLELAFAPSSNSICGAKFKTFLLEKSRVAHQARNWLGFGFRLRVRVTLTLTNGSGASRPAACLPLQA